MFQGNTHCCGSEKKFVALIQRVPLIWFKFNIISPAAIRTALILEADFAFDYSNTSMKRRYFAVLRQAQSTFDEGFASRAPNLQITSVSLRMQLKRFTYIGTFFRN